MEKYISDQLIDFCMEETTIECTNCHKGDGYMGDALSAIDYFFKRGWKATKENVYCPKCASKKLKHT